MKLGMQAIGFWIAPHILWLPLITAIKTSSLFWASPKSQLHSSLYVLLLPSYLAIFTCFFFFFLGISPTNRVALIIISINGSRTRGNLLQARFYERESPARRQTGRARLPTRTRIQTQTLLRRRSAEQSTPDPRWHFGPRNCCLILMHLHKINSSFLKFLDWLIDLDFRLGNLRRMGFRRSKRRRLPKRWRKPRMITLTTFLTILFPKWIWTKLASRISVSRSSGGLLWVIERLLVEQVRAIIQSKRSHLFDYSCKLAYDIDIQIKLYIIDFFFWLV